MNSNINVIKIGSNFSLIKILVIIIVFGVVNGRTIFSIELLIGLNNINILFFSKTP
jgi:hypothetical protein